MGLFKDDAERRVERNLQVKRSLREIQKNIKRNEDSLGKFKEKAVRAAQIGDKSQLALIRNSMRQTFGLKKLQERQILAIETAMQIKDQAESVKVFVDAMQAVAKAVEATSGKVNIADSLKEYEKAMGKAEALQEQMDLFLDTASGAEIFDTGSDAISDAELDAYIEDAAVDKETSIVDERIQAGMERVRKALKK